jgi:hypothetical protein
MISYDQDDLDEVAVQRELQQNVLRVIKFNAYDNTLS